MNPTHKLFRAFRITVLITLIALVLQFILGMYSALYVAFPDSLADGNAWAWSMTNSPIISAHVLLGTLLVVASLLTLGFSIALKSKAAIASTTVGLVMMLLAYLSGSAFLANVQLDAYSFVMALGYIGALAAYGAGFYLTRPVGQAAS